MKREVMITAGAAAILGVALAGCSHSGAVRTGNGAVAATSESNTKVVVDGKDQTVKGSVACTSAAGNVSIAIGGATTGASGAPTGIGAVLTDANPPVVKSVALGNVNGVTLGVGGTSGNANATKDGSSYKISGTASGADMSNPMAGPVSKSFEIDVTCP
ncbi:MAG TPA: lipoprotein LpqH [Mycobacterium sp.]|nr:lipoprotein LpqH [Mycobacterium sp.]